MTVQEFIGLFKEIQADEIHEIKVVDMHRVRRLRNRR